MAAFGFTEVVLKENNVTNSSVNKAMTNSSPTGLHSMQMCGRKQKRSSLPNILSTTAGRARNFLKRFSNSFVTSRNSRSLSSSQSKSKHMVSLSQKCSIDENRSLLLKDKITFNEKIGDNFDMLDNIDAASDSPIGPLLPRKWSRQEIANFTNKCGHPSSARSLTRKYNDVHECLDFKSHFHSSRKLKYDQDSEGICIKKKRVLENDVDSGVVQDRKQVPSNDDAAAVSIATLTTSKHSVSMTWSANGTSSIITSQQQIEHIACRVQTVFATIESNETSCCTFQTPLENTSNFPTKGCNVETAEFKTILGDSSLCKGNVHNNSKVTAQVGMCSPTKQLKTNFQDEERKCISSKIVMDSVLDIKPKSLKTKVTKSLLFLPYPKIPFKIKAVQPLNAPFKVFYCPSSMIPIVTTAGEVFEAYLQEITVDSKGQERFLNSALKFSCNIRVKSSDAAKKFDEIKEALRIVSNAYNIGRVNCINTSEVCIKDSSVIVKAEPDSFERYHGCLPLPHLSPTGTKELHKPKITQCSLQESSVDYDSKSIDVEMSNAQEVKAGNGKFASDPEYVNNEAANADTDRSQTLLRRSCRKVKREGLWEGRNAYATRITRPSPPQIEHEMHNLGNSGNDLTDKTYLERTFIVNQLVQDITGVPVVVLQRLSSDEIEKLLKL